MSKYESIREPLEGDPPIGMRVVVPLGEGREPMRGLFCERVSPWGVLIKMGDKQGGIRRVLTSGLEPLRVWLEGYEPGGKYYVEPPLKPIVEPPVDLAAAAQGKYDAMVEENRKLAKKHGDGSYQERAEQ